MCTKGLRKELKPTSSSDVIYCCITSQHYGGLFFSQNWLLSYAVRTEGLKQGPVLKAALDPRVKWQRAAKCQQSRDGTRAKSHRGCSTHKNPWLCSEQHWALMSLWNLSVFKPKRTWLLLQSNHPPRQQCSNMVTLEPWYKNNWWSFPVMTNLQLDAPSGALMAADERRLKREGPIEGQKQGAASAQCPSLLPLI